MNTDRDPALLPDTAWPQEVAFIPFIGDRYWSGIDGRRILLLGESPYDENADSLRTTRTYTKEMFGTLTRAERSPKDGRFFKPLDRLLTKQEDFSVDAAAEAWRGVSFINLAQEFAGTKAKDRPTWRQLTKGGEILKTSILPILQPDAILFLGRTAWRSFNDGSRSGRPSFQAERLNMSGKRRMLKEREIWRLEYSPDRSAWMTWVYHPSRNIDHWEDMAAALQYLIDLPSARKRP